MQIRQSQRRLTEADKLTCRRAIESGKATTSEVAFLSFCIAFHAAHLPITIKDWSRFTRLVAGKNSIFNRVAEGK